MTVVLVHGNPETPAIWAPLRAALVRDDVVAVHLPGFGIASPAGFTATADAYTGWLVGELEAIGAPVDLVGHDWGGGFVLRVAATRPDLLRSWASDVCGLLDPAYTWHDNAQIWQTPGEGEAWWEGVLAQPEAVRVELMTAVTGDETVGAALGAAMNAEMARCVLALYRSAPPAVLQAWGADVGAAPSRPGLAIIPADDPYTGGVAMAERMAARLGARAEVLAGRHHWWMLQDPAQGAAMLQAFWATAR